MASKMLILLVAVLSVMSAGAKRDYYYPDHEFDRTELGDSIDKASMSLLQEAYESGNDKNVIASPLGAFTLLSLYAGGAGAEGKEQIVKVLGAGNYSRLADSFSDLGSRLASVDSAFFTLANKIYLSDQYTLRPEFASLTARSQGEVEKIDFVDTTAATNTINQWGEEKTRGYIKKPVPDGAITPDTAVALFNLIFFQGKWNVPFEAQNTKEEEFYVDKTNTVKKPMMHLQQPLFYYESNNIGAKLLELPYQKNGFRMVIVLPNQVDGLSSVIEKGKDKGLLEDVFKLEPAYAEIKLYMPKFEINTELDLKELLPKIGIDKIFEEGANGIVRERAVVVSKAFQKAFVKVDEEGSTAGAFTGVIAVPVSSWSRPPPPIEVRVDHPFLFLILHEDKILFAGTYTH